MKAEYIMPTIKKADTDPSDVKRHRPLSVTSKLGKRLVCNQLMTYLRANNLLPDLQSAFSAHYSTDTAILAEMPDTRIYCLL